MATDHHPKVETLFRLPLDLSLHFLEDFRLVAATDHLRKVQTLSPSVK